MWFIVEDKPRFVMGHSDTPFLSISSSLGFGRLSILCSHHVTPIYIYLTISVYPSYPLPQPFIPTSTTYVAEPDRIIFV